MNDSFEASFCFCLTNLTDIFENCQLTSTFSSTIIQELQFILLFYCLLLQQCYKFDGLSMCWQLVDTFLLFLFHLYYFDKERIMLKIHEQLLDCFWILPKPCLFWLHLALFTTILLQNCLIWYQLCIFGHILQISQVLWDIRLNWLQQPWKIL